MSRNTLAACIGCPFTLLAASVFAAGPAPPEFSGVYPHLAATADSYSECGIGAVVPWADRLWYVSYVSHKSGGGVGLYEITPDLAIRRRPESVVGTHAGRMIHAESSQLIIGPYLIDRERNVRVFEDLATERVTAVMRHLTDPARKVYAQAMEGGFYEADVRTLEVTRLFDLSKEELGIQGTAHFKGGCTSQGRVVVANNTYHDGDQRQGSGDGRLAEWDGKTWSVIHQTAFCDVTTAGGIHGAESNDAPLYATGWDRASVLLAVLGDGQWSTYRLPKGSQSYDHAWCTEWPRIREAAPGQLMLDMHGLYYLMSPKLKPGNMAGLLPLAFHLRMTPDFCRWQGNLVLAGNEVSSLGHRHRTGGQPQSNLWLGSLEEIRRFGAPGGWGGPWYQDEVKAGVPSDPFFVSGFANRVLHLFEGAAPAGTRFLLEVDPRGDGDWAEYRTITLPECGYAWHVFPKDFSAAWVRITADRDTTATAQFCFDPHDEHEPGRLKTGLFDSLPRATEEKPRIHGGLLPFADRLWFISYVGDANGEAHGGALYEIGREMTFRRRSESLPGVFSNRKMIGGLLSIGPHLISDDGRVRTLGTLADEHLVASIRHPEDGKMFLLTGDGRLLEADLETLEVVEAANVPTALGLEDASLEFTAGHLAGKKVLVAATAPNGESGCLAEFDGTRWTLLDRACFAEISNLGSMSETVVAAGWDRASAVLKIGSRSGQWSTCRLPRAGSPSDRTAADQWSRIREVQTERMLMDVGGLFYEVSGLTYAWSIRPVAAHQRAISDFSSWRGMLVLAGNDAAAPSGSNYVRGGPECGLWFGKTDDLWQFDKPNGEGGPWLETPVRAGEASDPYLMFGFERKRIELGHDADRAIAFTIEVDPTVQRKHWMPYETITVAPGKKTVHEFPTGFSAHWTRVRVDHDCTATAQFVYNFNLDEEDSP
ncbi:MAG: hypothetical protein ABIP48_27775 [Planctomycetota bacterium]